MSMTEAERKRQARERMRAEGRRDRLFPALTDEEHQALRKHLQALRRKSQQKACA